MLRSFVKPSAMLLAPITCHVTQGGCPNITVGTERLQETLERLQPARSTDELWVEGEVEEPTVNVYPVHLSVSTLGGGHDNGFCKAGKVQNIAKGHTES